MLTIYSIPESLYCAKLRILLRHKNLEWIEVPPPGGYGSDEYKTIIPSGNLPALIDGDLILADSEAIAEYLNEKFPEPSMLPDEIELRARVRQRSRFHDTRLEPEVRKLFDYIEWEGIALEKVKKSVINTQSEMITKRLHQFGELLESDSLSETNQLTLGNCGFPVTFSWVELLTPIFDMKIDWPNSITEYKNYIMQFSAVNNEIDRYRSCLNEWLNP